MNRSPGRDLVVGVFVLAGLAAIAWLSVSIGGASYAGPGGKTLYAYFDEIGGLSERAAVVVGGVKVGRVVALELDQADYRAKVTMDVDRSLELPEDTSAAILTQGVLGDKLVALEPGGADEMIPDGGIIDLTQSAVVLERLIGKLVTSFGGGDDE
jgi:phospholipid/cholesterol/gamma-HCH transport system substrate-binding protein